MSNIIKNLKIINYDHLFRLNDNAKFKHVKIDNNFEYYIIDDFYLNVDEIYDYIINDCCFTYEFGLCDAAPVLRTLSYIGHNNLMNIVSVISKILKKRVFTSNNSYSVFSLYDGNLKKYYEGMAPHIDPESFIWLVYLDDVDIGTTVYKTNEYLKDIANSSGRYSGNIVTKNYEELCCIKPKKNRFVLYDANFLHKFGANIIEDFDTRLVQVDFVKDVSGK